MPVFGAIRDDILDLIIELAPVVNVSKGEFFFREADEGDSMFVLETGKVAIEKEHDKKKYFLSCMGPGDCFGEMELIDLGTRSASAVAVEDCTAIEISTGTLYKVYKEDPQQFAMIHMNMGREVSRRLRKADELLFQKKVEADFD